MSEIINQLKNISSFVTKEDLGWITPKLVNNYENLINKLANRTYGEGLSEVSKRAFFEYIKGGIDDACNTFFLTKNHWKDDRNLNSYLLKTIHNKSRQYYKQFNVVKKQNKAICPACKFFNVKSFLIREAVTGKLDGSYLRCSNCDHSIKSIEMNVDLETFKNNLFLESKLRLMKSFLIHSRKGYKCPDCARFIPKSTNGKFGIACPYPDCMFSGDISKLERMPHPTSLGNIFETSLNQEMYKDGSGKDFMSIQTDNNLPIDKVIELEQEFSKEINILKEVILGQLESIKVNNHPGTMLQKTSMYEAYYNMVDKNPEDMVSYLVHRNTIDLPIQANIFQEYVSIIKNSLPYTIQYSNRKHDVLSLTDPKISLFNGKTKFSAIVRNDNTVPNNTKEKYIGGKTLKYYGSCYLGLIIDICDKDSGKSIKDNIIDNSFVSITMDNDIKPGTNVEVTHYYISSHYEIGALVYLQRARRNIVDEVYYKIHGKERVAGS